jgi:hypothetical protein
MNNGMIRKLIPLAFLLVPLAVVAEGEVYKVVDKDGNVTFTDQRPSSNAQPMVLPELSIIETDVDVPESGPSQGEAEASEPLPLTPRELRRKYRDFRIISPQPDETFWGTANTIVVSWGSSQPIEDNLTVMLIVNGEAQAAPPEGSVTLTLERGEHQVSAEIRDARNRRIMATDTVTFYVKQYSANFNRPAISPGG